MGPVVGIRVGIVDVLKLEGLGRPLPRGCPGLLRLLQLGDHLSSAPRRRHDPRGAKAAACPMRQYARLLSDWLASIGLEPSLFGTHLIKRTRATLIYQRTGNLRAV
jgi:hypothetical protein